jgi:hypothetical protein
MMPIKRDTFGTEDISGGMRELLGVQHCKTIISDNDVIISSTNHG